MPTDQPSTVQVEFRNTEILVDRFGLRQMKLPGRQRFAAGTVKLVHPSYTEEFWLEDKGRSFQHTWFRGTVGDTSQPASITEGLLLWHIYNGPTFR